MAIDDNPLLQHRNFVAQINGAQQPPPRLQRRGRIRGRVDMGMFQNQNVPVQGQNNAPVQNLPPQPQLTPTEQRRVDKFNVAQVVINDLKQQSKKAHELIGNPYQGAWTQDLVDNSETLAGKHGFVEPDKLMTPILHSIQAAQGQVERGELREARGPLEQIVTNIGAAIKDQKERREKASLSKSKETYTSRITRYQDLNVFVMSTLNSVTRTEKELTKAVTHLCTKVGEMVKLSKAGQADVLDGRLIAELDKRKDSEGITDTLKQLAQQLLVAARLEQNRVYTALSNGKTDEEKAELLLELGTNIGPGDRGSDEKGKSDSFFLKGPDGALKYVMKPIQGESLTSADWEPGGGPVREILASKLNDLLQASTNLDCRSLPTVPIALEDPTFAEGGGLSKESRRVGSLQGVAPGGGKTVAQVFDDVPKNPVAIKTFQETFNEDDCQAIAVRHFLTMDQDVHGGNFLIDKQGDGPGQTRLIPIDAGQSLPNPGGASRNSAALRLNRPPDTGNLNPHELLILQLPAASKPFSGAALNAIQQLDPTQTAADLKLAHDQLVIDQPEMAGKVDPGSFDLLRKSGKFLKLAAAAGLTLYEISQVYGDGFGGVINADANGEDAALQLALNTALALKQLGGNDGLAGLNAQFQQLGFPLGPTSVIHELRHDQKELILTNRWSPAEWNQHHENALRTVELVDIEDFFDAAAPETVGLPALIQNGFQGKNAAYIQLLHDYKRRGGDPILKKMMVGNEASYAVDVTKSLEDKMDQFGVFRNAKDILAEAGGSGGLFEVIGVDKKGMSINDQTRLYFQMK